MTNEQPEPISFKKFSNSVLPWIILGGALVLYLATLNHWVTFTSLSFVAKISGFDWQKPLGAPFYYLVTLPIHWLPVGWQAIALNVFSAVCAALTLMLLARSVALLPQDRTKEQRLREHDEFSLLSIRKAWIPVVMAVMLCGFQLTFWENATVASGEIFDLLLFAYCIRCLLEFRLTENLRWLYKMSLLYGFAITNNWAMIAYFPLFLLALGWIRGLAFFNLRFIGRMVGLMLPGLLLYLLLPAIGILSNSDLSFWDLLKANLTHQKMMTIGNPFIGGLKFDFLTMALTSLIPMILVGTRWTSDYADVSPIGTILTNLMFRVLHLTLLVFCVWVFFDYKFSPRTLGHGMVPFLTLYYLSALSAGYLCGYVLLIFGREGERAWGKSRSSMRGFNKAIAFVVAVGAIGVPAWLFYRNFSVVRELNGPAVKNFAKQMAKTLPKDAIVLSDDPTRLYLMQALDATEKQNDKRIYLNTRHLLSFRYQEYLANRYGAERDVFRQVQALGNGISPFALITLIERLHQTHPIYYLHPSFGYYFERFYPRQRGLVFELKPFQNEGVIVPKLEESDIAGNEKFWNEISAKSLKSLTELADKIPDASALCTFYSSALNAWGVELQRNQDLKLAHEKFYIAWKYLDPNNIIAQINGRYNEKLQDGDNKPLKADEESIKQINYLRGLLGAVGYFGPIDEPGGCIILAQTFARSGNLRQAAQQYHRLTELMPEEPFVHVKLADISLELHQPDEALKQIRQIKAGALDELDLLNIEARALLLKNDFAAGEKLLLDALAKDPKDDLRLKLVFQFYVAAGDLAKGNQPAEFERRYKKALGTLDQIIVLHPDDGQCLLNKARLLQQMGNIDDAVSVLSHAIDAEPGNVSARMNRAIFLLQAGRLDAAQADYLALQKMMSTDLHKVYFGLAQIAEQKKDAADAIRNFEAYLKAAPEGTIEYLQVQNRLKELRSGKKS